MKIFTRFKLLRMNPVRLERRFRLTTLLFVMKDRNSILSQNRFTRGLAFKERKPIRLATRRKRMRE
jgi:hypothetical protein